jgi:hypothetical protein
LAEIEPIRQTAWQRGKAEAAAARHPLLGLLVAVIPGTLSALVVADSVVWRAVLFFVVGVVGYCLVPVVWAGVAALRAPYTQRDQARDALLELQMRRPHEELRSSGVKNQAAGPLEIPEKVTRRAAEKLRRDGEELQEWLAREHVYIKVASPVRDRIDKWCGEVHEWALRPATPIKYPIRVDTLKNPRMSLDTKALANALATNLAVLREALGGRRGE